MRPAMDKSAPKAIHLKDYAPPPYLIDTVDLAFDLGEEVTEVRSRLEMRVNPSRVPDQAAAPLVLDGQDMRLVSIAIDGRPLEATEYAVGPESLTIFNPPPSFTLEVVTELKPQENTSLEGLYRTSGNFCTQ